MNALILQSVLTYWELKLQTAAAAITNTANVVFDDSEFTNSAEVEQETEQENECTDFAACDNTIGAQTQTAYLCYCQHCQCCI